ncbi:Putative UDP-N-acetylglucosamine 2-epimerase [Listeria monocytogenes N53-1]|nr:Putative UDP-N-acetylglucosamine 2-epimerase [Listeria monocytogenes N53-1]
MITAQHREMLDQVLEIFDIKPDIDLDIMKKGQTLADITSRVMNGINEVIAAENPDIVLVHGDTTTMSKLDLERGINIRRFQKR